MTTTPLFKIYYAATGLFLVLDYALGVNVRLAFLDAWPGWRALYYGLCLACLGLIVWRPAVTTLVTTVESLITLTALVLSMGVRVIGMSATVLATGGEFITSEEVINFIIAGAVAWLGWHRGSTELHRQWRR